MAIDTHDDPQAPGHGDFERRDIRVAGVIYFIAGLVGAAILIHVLLLGFYDWLDKRDKANQRPVSPLVSNVSGDTRKVPPSYPQQVFPNPRLETNERSQLDDIRRDEAEKLNSYDWVDQKTGTVRIPIERAMDLLAQRGLPVRPQGTAATASVEKKGSKK